MSNQPTALLRYHVSGAIERGDAEVITDQPARMLATIPFQGFYDSIHSEMIDYCEERDLSDENGDVSQGIAEAYWADNDVNYRQVFVEYAKAFTKTLADELETKLEFESLQSPREYDFSTDRIFAYISYADLAKLIAATPSEAINSVAKGNFTSRSGFISSYSPLVATWGDITQWDHNQIGTIVQAAVENEGIQEIDLVSDYNCNGELSEMLYDAMGPKCRRLLRISSYLRERQERKHYSS
jgi:hypothetical protein